MAIQGKNKGILSEKILLDTLDRVAKNSMGYTVLYVNISKLKPKNRHPRFVKVIARLFDSVVGTTKGVMFVLSNGDFAILSKNTPEEVVDEAVKKLREGLQADPILSEEKQNFARVYSFPKEFVEFYEKIEHMSNENIAMTPEKEKRPLQAGELDSVVIKLDDMEIGDIVKRQSALTMINTNSFKVLLQEFFVAVKDLEHLFSDNVDLVANRWLFQYLSQNLDKKTLSAFKTAELSKWPSNISINSNLSTIYSKEFAEFAKDFIKDDQHIIVEVQMMDVLNDLKSYHEVKEILHQGGHKILLDSLTPTSLNMLNMDVLSPDMIKIFWEPLMEYETENDTVKKVVEKLGAENVILAKCDGEKALKWGLSHGIKSFQGPFLDEIEISLIRQNCPDKNHCNIHDCIKRRRMLQGSQRNGCQNLTQLEKIL